ncbi:MAG: hypothetical protein ACOYVF_11655 [Candidatus Zixiibacteriota bacterium]
MDDRTRFGFKHSNQKTRNPRRNKDFNYSEEKFDTMMKRQQRRQMKIQKEQLNEMHLEDMNIEDLKEYILETEY